MPEVEYDMTTDRRENLLQYVLDPLEALAEEGQIRATIMAEVERPQSKVLGDTAFTRKKVGILVVVDEPPVTKKLPFDKFRTKRFVWAIQEVKKDLKKFNIVSMYEADMKSLGFTFTAYRIRSIVQLLQFRKAVTEGGVYAPAAVITADEKGTPAESQALPAPVNPVAHISAFHDPEPDQSDKAHSLVLAYIDYVIQEDVDERQESTFPT